MKRIVRTCDVGVQCDDLCQPVLADASVQCQLDSFVSSTPQHGVYDSELSDVTEDMNTSYVQSQESSSLSSLVNLCSFCVIVSAYLCRSEETFSYGSDPPLPPEKQTTFLVFQSALMVLLSVCVYCATSSVKIKKIVIGSFLRVIQSCQKCKKCRTWKSQPFIGTLPAGNVLTSAAILYAGALPTQALRVFSVLNCCTITPKTFFRHQSKFLQPAIESVWKQQQSLLFKEFMHGLVLSGDGRADSLGRSAKYRSYTVIELTCNKVVGFKLVQVGYSKYSDQVLTHNVMQSNEVNASYHMEKEGLRHVLEFLHQNHLTVDTDRHRQINK